VKKSTSKPKRVAKPAKAKAKANPPARKQATRKVRAATRKPRPATRKPRPATRKPRPAKRPTRTTSASQRRGVSGARWVKFVEQHGVVLASARGPVPSIAEAVAGEPIVGSWWAHPRGNAIFDALSSIDDSPDIRCFKLVDGKVTFVHKKAWAALVRLGRDGVIAPEQLAAVQQEHTASGDHRNVTTPFPDWVDADTSSAADTLTTEQARAQLAWVEG
jgi:hypothetical protein